MQPSVFDDRSCFLGEGPLWHPLREQLFWVDIIGRRLLTRKGDEAAEWSFDVPVSALGWVDKDCILVAGANGLIRFDLVKGEGEMICPLPPSEPALRTNDGRADPKGGFWFGTMGMQAEPGAGTIYRYYKGELRALRPNIQIPNATCFSPEGDYAFFTDTRQRIIWKQRLDAEGWPIGDRSDFLDLREAQISPDGAIFDSEGYMWVACWGKACVIRFDRDGQEDLRIELPTSQATCPAFGGPDLTTLFITTARQGLNDTALSEQPLAGMTFSVPTSFRGIADPRVLL
ncbi:SMP-30/gluconolactonase/LRE family protein [Aquamicrobium zhengzhouense]|uniref:SMP-30/gluconolactonase/LRE family protein n=1 Tax=Aquamicrobium zhengzhouense TaxID=2781738 RepID=A0ABS0S8B2_9HYPH|nr:SMP-30/gluconolactonase/LRE family protein [Aquamicrobium zhengzhouense]MBI1619521.1 SMP-30/gluconolactonase/LRE family protein [Aquamicrobium zhengzhouense]